MENPEPKQEKISFFLFINSKSGGGLGRKYLSVPNRKITYQYGKDTTIVIHCIDLFDEQDRLQGLEHMRKAQARVDKRGRGKVVGVVCGGDGTVLWVVTLVSEAGIDMTKVLFCIIPIGTGNDFSRCLRWGGSPISFSHGHLQELKTRLLQWLEAEESWFDVWHATISTYEDGEIIQIRDKREVGTKLTEMKRGFCNYFGVGVDARICYYVELKRQKNKWINLSLYGCIGLCKYFQRIRTTNQAIHTFKVGSQNEGQQKVQQNDREEDQYKEQRMEGEKNEPLLQDKSQNAVQGNIQLKPGYGNLLALNSIRYMAGLQNVWNTSKLGIRTNNPPQFTEQRFDDGKIEFLGFKNELRLGLERIGNFGTRVAQGEGPYVMKFNRTSSNETFTYIHIDGEAMKMRQLKEVLIQKSKLAPNGRIRVLIRRE